MSSRAYALSSAFPVKLQVSDDLGVTWSEITPTGLPVNPLDIKDIASDPYYAYNVLICGYNGTGIRLSTDAGLSFTTITGTTGINFDKVLFQSSEILWAFGDVIYKSLDAGVTWINTTVSAESIYGSPGVRVTAVFSEFAEPDNVYIGINEKVFSNINLTTWSDLGSGSVIPVGDKITSIYRNNNESVVACSDGIYRDTPFVSWTSTLSLGYSVPYSNYLGTIPNTSIMYVLDAYGNIYKSTNQGLTWSGILSTIPLAATPPITQAIRLYTTSTYVVYTDTPSKIYRSTDSGVTNTLIDTFSSSVIGLTGSYNVDCLECPQKYEYSEEYNACISENPFEFYLCFEDYTYDFNTNTCIPLVGDPVPAIELYSETLCQIIDITGRGRAECNFLYYINPCGFELTPCTGSSEPILTDTDLSDYLTNVITIQGSELCYTITELPDGIYPNYTDVIVDQVFTDCPECLPKYPLYSCNNIEIVIYTQDDLAEYVGQTINISEYPNDCWQVGPSMVSDQPIESVSVTSSFATCSECNVQKYQLGNCFNDSNFIISDSDLQAVLNKTISIVGYPGICFSVGLPTCECIKISGDLGAGPFTTTIQATGILLNNRNQYAFTNGGNTYLLNWNDTTSRWELNNQTLATAVGYSGADIDCPYTSYWVNIPSFSVESCATVIYDITVDTVYPDCECCITKSCT